MSAYGLKLQVWLSLAVLALVGSSCLSRGTGDAGGETHWQKGWLAGCVSSAQCGGGLECISHLCTVACDDDEGCDLAKGAVCLDVGGERVCALPERIDCSASALSCDDERAGWLCPVGPASGCAQPIARCEGETWQSGTLDTCRERITTVSDGPRASVQVVLGDRVTPIDILFVVDNSTSMFDEQRTLATGVRGLIQRLATKAEVDVRVAATTVDMQCEPDGTSTIAARGVFNRWAAIPTLPSQHERVITACAVDADCPANVCATTGECGTSASQWECQNPGNTLCEVNPNGTLKTRCRRRCGSDDDCTSFYGPAATCHKPSENEGDWGCVITPPTSGCATGTPAVIDASHDPEWVACAVAVGSNQQSCLRFEQGLEASRAALDRDGPNAGQARAFHRDGLLAVVYVSDEEDCSTRATIAEGDYNTCGLLATTDEGGPLVPVREYVEFLKSQRAPGAVVVMAVVGQSLELEPLDIASDEAAYRASKGNGRTCHQQTTICQTAHDSADLGSRYAELTRTFGSDGAIENLCAVDDLGDSVRRLEERLVLTVKRVCTPREDLTGLAVRLVRGDVPSVLVEGEGDDGYQVVREAAECEHGTAIVPNARMAAGAG